MVVNSIAELATAQRKMQQELHALDEKLGYGVNKRIRGGEIDEIDQLWKSWELKEWRRQEQMAWDRGLVKLSADVPASHMPLGERYGPMEHWRHGLIGAVQYWAKGSKDDAADLIYQLVVRLGMVEKLR